MKTGKDNNDYNDVIIETFFKHVPKIYQFQQIEVSKVYSWTVAPLKLEK